MTRNLDLIRQIMLALEQDSRFDGRSHRHLSASEVAPIPGFTDDMLAYNLMMIIDEKWLDADYGMNSGKFRVTRLTADMTIKQQSCFSQKQKGSAPRICRG
jgi:hypothetical protein